MARVSVSDAQIDLVRLVERALDGEEVVIEDLDGASVRLEPVMLTRGKRQFGALKGKAKLDDSFFDPLPDEELDAWEGR